jgi:dolichol-phosphate mannosyltransferase
VILRLDIGERKERSHFVSITDGKIKNCFGFVLRRKGMVLNGISIVTTTWNERENIEKLVPSIRNVLQCLQNEIIVVDDNSPDGTIQIAKRLADIAVTKVREGQSKGLLYGMKLAKYPIIITIDADLENDPKHIPKLIQKIAEFDIVVASRTKLPRISEKIASKTLGRIIGVTDTFSNLRAYKKDIISKLNLRGGETFGAEFLVTAKKKGITIGEIKYDPSPRRKNPRIGGKTKANLRLIWALIKSLIIYLI